MMVGTEENMYGKTTTSLTRTRLLQYAIHHNTVHTRTHIRIDATEFKLYHYF